MSLTALRLAVLCAHGAGDAAAADQAGNALMLRWDNTLKYSAAWRLNDPDPALITGANGDEGDRNFRPGFISNRVDLLSELDIAAGNVGASVSGAAWYDTVYTQNHLSLNADLPASRYPLPQRFTSAVRRLHGRNIELLNGFVYGTFEAGGAPLSVRVGRHTLVWGESLFFAGNGIAAAQAPVDAIKAMSVPAIRAKEVFMPVAQASVHYQPRPEVGISAYYQLEWRKTRLPGVGTYFSTADFLDAGGYRIYVGRDQYLTRSADAKAPDSGQFGAALRITGETMDYGFYALRFHAKEPQIYIKPNAAPSAAAATAQRPRLARPAAYGVTPGIVTGGSGALEIDYPFVGTDRVGGYTVLYPRGIELYGASFNSYAGDSAIAGEISVRRRMPLASIALIVPPGADADGRALYARGTTLHTQVSTVTQLSPGRLWRAASMSVEVAANHRLRVATNAAALDPTRDRTALTFRALFEPSYYEVLPGLNVTVPVSVGFGLLGRSSTDSAQIPGAGDLEVGITATYRAVWEANLSVTHFIGGPARQSLTDRDFISFSIQRTF